jgi:hypothetical protein
MQSVCTTGNRVIGSLALSILFSFNVLAQDNSPWSRYGLGDLVPSSNIATRGMGGVSAGFTDFQAINFLNPASYGSFGAQRAIFDVGLDINNRTLRNNRGDNYSSANAYISYMAAGFQVKPQKSKIGWGVVFGLRPLTKVSYNILNRSRISAGDSMVTQYEGSGGTNQAFAGTGITIKNFSVGINGGYRFGSKDYSTRVFLLNDTVPDRYTPGSKETRNNFGGLFAELGVQYRIDLNKKSSVTIGAYGSMQNKMKVRKSEKFESVFLANETGIINRIDSVFESSDVRGNIEYPSYYGVGFLYDVMDKSKLSVGVDFTATNWSNYRYFNAADLLQNTWQVKAGAQFVPDIKTETKRSSYWSSVIYRAGFNYSKEPFTVLGADLKSYGVTLGVGLPIRRFTFADINRSNVINAAFEFGQRGNNTSALRENYFRFSLGFSLSDIWFIKRKYD